MNLKFTFLILTMNTLNVSYCGRTQQCKLTHLTNNFEILSLKIFLKLLRRQLYVAFMYQDKP